MSTHDDLNDRILHEGRWPPPAMPRWKWYAHDLSDLGAQE